MDLQFTEFVPDPEDNKPSQQKCLICQGPMTIGDEKALGVCLECYCKAQDEAMNED